MKAILRSTLKKTMPQSIVRHKLSGHDGVLFTFDDGPNPEITPQVLDILDEYDAKAMFFVVGAAVAQRPDLVAEIVARGHAIGNHSWSHQNFAILNSAQVAEEINACRDVVYSACGVTPYFFRPPRGVVTPAILWATRKCGCRIMRWSMATGEYSHLQNAGVEARVDDVLAKLHKGAIIVCHDEHRETPLLLKKVLPRMQERGVDFHSMLDSMPWNSSSDKMTAMRYTSGMVKAQILAFSLWQSLPPLQ